MTTEKHWTVNAIKDAMRGAGSHWFDPDTMRFFKCKVLPSVYQGPGGVFFVSSERCGEQARKYTVCQFRPDDPCRMGTIGDFNAMSRAQAIQAAKLAAGGDGTHFVEVAQDFAAVSVVEQFVADLNKHGCDANDKDATSLILRARRHHALMEKLCSDERFCRQLDKNGDHPQVTECRRKIKEEAYIIGAKAVIFSGDPRGCTVKLTFADGFTNDFGKEGYCVPTSTSNDNDD